MRHNRLAAILYTILLICYIRVYAVKLSAVYTVAVTAESLWVLCAIFAVPRVVRRQKLCEMRWSGNGVADSAFAWRCSAPMITKYGIAAESKVRETRLK